MELKLVSMGLAWRSKSGGWVRAAVLALCCLVIGACGKPPQKYDQSTPDNVIKSAVAMVKDNQARELSNLIYAESPDMRGTLTRLGKLFEGVQGLSKTAQERFPEEFAKLKEDALNAAADGKPSGLISAMLSSQNSRRGNRGGGFNGDSGADPDTARELINQLFADPFGWLERNSQRLTTIQPADDTAYVLLDGQPAIPLIGLAMRKDRDKWYISLPSNVPPISSAWPRSRQQWSILASMITIIDKAVRELTSDVQSGRVTSLKSLVDKASDKLLFPAGIAFVAYGKELDVRSRVDRRVSQFTRRQSAWLKERQSDGGKGVSAKLMSVLSSLAQAEIETGVRTRNTPNFESVSTGEFEDTLKAWLKNAGLSIDFSGDLASPSIDDAVGAWQKTPKPAPPGKK